MRTRPDERHVVRGSHAVDPRLSGAVVLLGVLSACGATGGGATAPCASLQPGDLVITEVLADPAGVDTGSEWLEVFNRLGTRVELKGLTLYTRDTDGSGGKSHVVRAGAVEARARFVLGDVRSGPNPAWVDYSYGTGLGALGNSRGVLGLRCGNTVIDEVTWTRASRAGRSRMFDGALEPDAVANDDESRWCDTPADLLFSANAGTPGQPNPVCPLVAAVGSCLDNGVSRRVVPPEPGDLIITEVMANPAKTSDVTGEWFELLATADVDVNDLKISSVASSTKLTRQDCVRLVAGEYALFARSADAFVNGGLPTPRATYSLSLSDNNERLGLWVGDVEVDTAAFLASSAGRAWQLDPAKLDVLSNDDPANFCKAAVRWAPDGGGDYGSPGRPNPDCAFADAGAPIDPSACFDAELGASRPRRTPAVGDLTITEWMADPQLVSDAVGEWFEARVNTDVDLNGLVLAADNSTSRVDSPDCLPASAGTEVLFARNADPQLNGQLPPVNGTFSFGLVNTGTHRLALQLADGGVLDELFYSASTPGTASQLSAGLYGPADNDDTANVCRATTRWGAGTDLGTPGRPNEPCGGAAADGGTGAPPSCFDPLLGETRPLRSPAVGDLAITEWMADPAAVADAVGEWLEVHANADFDFNGLSLVADANARRLDAVNCLSVSAGSDVVFARNADPLLNGGLPSVLATFSFDLVNSGTRRLAVLGGDGGVLDELSYTGSTPGASTQLGVGLTQPLDNDVPSNLCTTPVGVRFALLPDGGLTGDRGTPAAPNVACP